MADEKYSALTDGGGLAAGDEFAVARAGASVRVSPIGVPVLVYRYTVTGSDKASIDTGVDSADAGSNDWTNGDLLEIFITARCDTSATNETGQSFFNDDTTAADYFGGILREIAGTVSGVGFGSTASGCLFLIAGASAAANVFSATRIVIPNYAGTVAYKACICEFGNPDQSDGNVPDNRTQIVQFKSTAAISRFKCNPATAGKKFKVGSQLLIYKRLAS